MLPSPSSRPGFLRRLPPGWEAVREGPLRGTSRWLLVGPPGGVVVSALPYRSRVRAGAEHLTRRGRRTPDAEQARAAAWLACAWLTDLAGDYVPVRALLVRPAAARHRVDDPPVGYWVCGPFAVARWLSRLPHAMTAADAAELARIARMAD